eukprot:5923484-Karenia_brevis.AAC.1
MFGAKGDRSLVVSLTLGATREFKVARRVCAGKSKPDLATSVSLALGHGDLLAMEGYFQDRYVP